MAGPTAPPTGLQWRPEHVARSAAGTGPQRAGGQAIRGERFAIGANAAVSFGNVAFLVMVARTLSPAGFGGLAAVCALLLLYQVPASAFQIIVARSTASQRGPLPGVLLADSLLGGLIVCAVAAAASPLLATALHLGQLAPFLLLAVAAVPIGVALVPEGVLVASGRLGTLGATLALGTVVEIGLGIGLVHGGLGLDGALVAVVAGELVTAGTLVLLTRHALVGLERSVPLGDSGAPGAAATRGLAPAPGPRSRGASAASAPVIMGGPPPLGYLAVADGKRSPRWAQALPVVMAYSGYWLLAGVGVLVARHWLDPTASGDFAAAATASDLVVLVPAALANAWVLRFAKAERRPAQARRRLGMAVALTLVVGAAGAAVAFVAAAPLVGAVFDGSYRRAAFLATPLVVAATLFGVATVVVVAQLGRGAAFRPLVPWAGVVALVVAAGAWHPDTQAIAWESLGANAAVCAGLVVPCRRRRSVGDRVERARLETAPGEVELTVVVPYYNPGPVLRVHLEAILGTLEAAGASFEVIAVSDGSTDGSDHSIEQIADRRLRRVVLDVNQGKGAALGAGLVLGRGRYLGFLDADGELGPELLVSFLELARVEQPDVVLGSKRHPASTVAYPPLRRVYSRGYQLLVRVMFRLELADTQTGIKLIRREVLEAVLPRMVEKRFAWDLELLVVARHLGFRRFLEAPVVLRHRFTSTVSWRAVERTFVDTAAIFYRLWVLGAYDDDLAGSSGSPETSVPVSCRPGLGRALVRPWVGAWAAAPLESETA